MTLLTLSKNEIGTDYIVGDIHASFIKLQKALEDINFDSSKDRLICVGDLIDRGPNPEMALEWLNYSWFFSVKGNHEVMAEEFYHRLNNYYLYLDYGDRNGNNWFMNSPRDIQKLYIDKFEQLPLVIQVEDVGIVHAELIVHSWNNFLDNLDREEVIHDAIWGRNIIRTYAARGYRPWALDPILDIDLVVHGHSILSKPVKLGNRLYIDTGAYLQDRNFTIMSLQQCRDFKSPLPPKLNPVLYEEF